MERKEHYRRSLPHFQQPGQEYFITASLDSAVPVKALKRYSEAMERIKANLNFAIKDKLGESVIADLKREYSAERNKYIIAYDDLLAQDKSSEINLNLPANQEIMFNAFRYYEGRRLENHAFCVMRNHYHWVVRIFEKDEEGKPVYLQDILKVVNGVSANKINELEHKKGRTVWQGENFETTIRNDRHWYNAVQYTINNPVKAGLVKNWWEWEGTWCAFGWSDTGGRTFLSD